MLGIQRFLESFSSAIVSIWQFVQGFFRDSFRLVKLLSNIPRILVSIFSWIPGEIWVVLSMLFGVVIFYKILGREG